MKVGIKFCGGCNPFYERGVVSKKFMEAHPEYDFEFVNENNEYNIIVVVCGCMIRCTTVNHLKSKYGYIFVSSEKDFEYIPEKIKEMSSK